ncbi:putative glycosyltransferase [Rubidibacter lacunae KORDI 51-2]|uniref:Putative glycosyltransferase n=1 Tax=Rubidibacter lacunae KORDI 51-2 TaxID=582515 RepID=U5DR13_9CHRO|nr:glycosyltransferase [Rubidibacter lacunae]ERN43059.1 putative glycosyltransferase [Rubidibacter lacunae KORDI 51-2]
MTSDLSKLGLVAIGRNEGDRLRQCLDAIVGKVACVVYVDSGSVDNSIELAKQRGIDVVELDLSQPFTAARARNAGWVRLMELDSTLEYVQFVDGDCEIAAGWLETARSTLQGRPEVAAVCGRRRERFPERSPYNRLCDLEWNTPIGETLACGGDAMMRVAALKQVGGFAPHLIAGEEPELCYRLRQQGWKVLRIDADMTLHDAAMVHFRQWWQRALRAGHACAQGAWLHGREPERYCVKECRSILLWGAIVPTVALGLAWPTRGLSLAIALVYPLMIYKVFRFKRSQCGRRNALLYAVACIAGKFPNVFGVLSFHRNRLLGRGYCLVEYK